MNNNASNKSGEEKPGKKTYCTPQLAVYGNISEITRMVDNTGGKADGSLVKTHETA